MNVYLAINNVEIVQYPSEYEVEVMDLDDGDGTFRTADGTMNRERITVKRQITMGFPAMPEDKMSALLKSMKDEFFDFTFFDIEDGEQKTKTFYVGNRKAGVAIIKNGVYWWQGLSITLTER